MSMPVKPVLAVMADWICALDGQGIPGDVSAVALSCLIDTLGVGLAGGRTSVAQTALGLVLENSAAGAAETLVGRTGLVASAAAFANGCAAHALDFDDNSYAAFVHGSAVIVPAALAVAQFADRSGSDLIAAIVAGSEAQYALGIAATNAIYDRGWWTTGVFGPVGACAAAAYLLRLSPEATSRALGLALAATGGMKACFGTDAKALMAGRSCEAGVVAALLASRGATGPADAVESRAGFAALFTNGTFDPVRFSLPGTEWRLQSPGVDIKRIPVCLSSHAAVDAVLDLVRDHDIAPGDIVRIECDVPQIIVANLIYDRPTTRQQAQFSMHYAVAASLCYGRLGLAELEPDAVNSTAVQEMMPRIDMVSTEYWDAPQLRESAPEGALVRITVRDGRQVDRFRAFPRGAASDPLSQAELNEKFISCCTYAGIKDGPQLLARLRNVADLAGVRSLLASAQ